MSSYPNRVYWKKFQGNFAKKLENTEKKNQELRSKQSSTSWIYTCQRWDNNLPSLELLIHH